MKHLQGYGINPLYTGNPYTVNLCKTATLKNTKKLFSRRLPPYTGQKYCRMLQRL